MTRLSVFVGLLAVLTCSNLKAQIVNVEIPFAFQLGESAMPAGEYQISYSAGSPNLIWRSKDGKRGAIVMTTPKNRTVATEAGILTFHRYGDAVFFDGLWRPGSSSGGSAPKSAREKELARLAKSGKPTEFTVASR